MEDIWSGSDYELTIEFADTEQVEQAFITLMRAPVLTGFWTDQQRTLSLCPPLFADSPVAIVYSALKIVPGRHVPCRINALALGYLTISIPQSAFAKHFPYAYPLTFPLNPWLLKINDCLMKLATAIYRDVPFLIAAIGEEIAGDLAVNDVFEKDFPDVLMIVPQRLLQGKRKPRQQWIRLML